MSERLTSEQRAIARKEWNAYGVAISHIILKWFIPQALDDLEALESEALEYRLTCRDWADVNKTLTAECDTLRAQLEQVDDVLTVNWVGPRDDGNYRKALADLVANAIREHDDPAVNEDAARKRDEMAALRARCEQLQRENEALVHGVDAGPTR